MQKIVLTLFFCSVVAMADTKQENNDSREAILQKTLQEVREFKRSKNEEIHKLKFELQTLRKKFNLLKFKKNQEIKKLKREVKIGQNKIIAYKKSQKKLKKQLKDTKETVRDLHVMLKKKQQIVMDEYALGRYYYNQ